MYEDGSNRAGGVVAGGERGVSRRSFKFVWRNWVEGMPLIEMANLPL